MTNGNIIKGLQILHKNNLDGYDVCAEHDQIWAGNEPASYTHEEKDTLEALGWFIDSQVDHYSAFV